MSDETPKIIDTLDRALGRRVTARLLDGGKD